MRIGVIEFGRQDPQFGLQQASRFLSFEGLIGNDRDGTPRPRLVESWSVSPDGLRWMFTLRANARFHDETPVDASTVKESLDASLASLGDRSLFPGLADIVQIEVSSPTELLVILSERSTFLLDDLSMAISKLDARGSRVGTGPYIATAVSPSEIMMSAFDQHYQGRPTIRQILWKPYPALRTAWAGMMRGEIDFLFDVGQENVEFVRQESTIAAYPFMRQYVFSVVFNSARRPLDDLRIRQALNFAVDRERIVRQALKGEGVVAHTAGWPRHWAYDDDASGHVYDPARANAILDGVRPPRSAGSELSSPKGTRFSFTCLLPETFSVWERMALMVQRQLFEVGVEMKLEVLPPDAFNERVAGGDFDAVFLEMIGGTAMSRPYVFWHSKSPRNTFGYASPKVDSALDAIRHASNDTDYRIAVSALQQGLVADPPAIFIGWGQTTRAVSRRFSVRSSPGGDVLASVASWQPGVGEFEAGQ